MFESATQKDDKSSLVSTTRGTMPVNEILCISLDVSFDKI